MSTFGIVLLMVYVLGIIPTYLFFDKKTTQSKFNKVWFSIFWPAVVVISAILKLIKKI